MAPPQEELSEGTVSVTCMVEGFKPEDIDVEWQKNGQPEPEGNYRTTPPQEDTDGSYFLYSKLRANKNEWKNGNTYTCVVMHEALHNHYTQRTITVSSGN